MSWTLAARPSLIVPYVRSLPFPLPPLPILDSSIPRFPRSLAVPTLFSTLDSRPCALLACALCPSSLLPGPLIVLGRTTALPPTLPYTPTPGPSDPSSSPQYPSILHASPVHPLTSLHCSLDTDAHPRLDPRLDRCHHHLSHSTRHYSRSHRSSALDKTVTQQLSDGPKSPLHSAPPVPLALATHSKPLFVIPPLCSPIQLTTVHTLDRTAHG